MDAKIKSMARHILMCVGYRGPELEKLVASVHEWYPIWQEFKGLARGDMLAGIRPGKPNYRSQMHLLHEIRKRCPARGGKPYEVSNTLAPVFARIYNSLFGEYFVVIESKKMKEARL